MKTRSAPHLLMTTDTVGGVWTYSLELARALQRYEVRISLATMGARLTAAQRHETEQLANVELFESELKLEWMENPWDDVAEAGAWLLELDRHLAPDLVHLNQFAFGAARWSAPCLVVGHSCVLSWFQSVKGEPAGAEWKHYRAVVRSGLQGADLVAAPSQAMLACLNEHYGPLPRRRTILNGRRTCYGQQVPKQPLVLTAGRLWDEAKNVAAVAAIAPHISWPIHVAGIPHPDRSTGTAAELSDQLHFLGRLDAAEMERAFSRASIYALPARYEPFGLTPLEAALAGCALVLGDIPTLREVWQDSALFVPPDNTGALQDTIQSLINDEELRRAYVDRSRKRALELSEERMAAEYWQVYQELMGIAPPQTTSSHRSSSHMGHLARQGTI